MTIVNAVRLDLFTDGDYFYFRSLISDKKKAIIDKYKKTRDYRSSLLGDCLARSMISKITQLPMRCLDFYTDQYGKPMVNAPGIHFNISHSGEWVVCVVSDKQCGIDVEKITITNLAVAKRLFSEKEYRRLAESSVNRDSYFCELWVIKESYVKYTGCGIDTSLQKTEIVLNNGKYSIWKNNSKICNTEVLFLDHGYKMAVSHMNEKCDVNHYCNSDRIINLF